MRMSKNELVQYQANWLVMNQFELQEVRSTPLTIKYRQFLELLKWTRQLGWAAYLAKDDDKIRRLWQKLRKAYRAGKKIQRPAH